MEEFVEEIPQGSMVILLEITNVVLPTSERSDIRV